MARAAAGQRANVLHFLNAVRSLATALCAECGLEADPQHTRCALCDSAYCTACAPDTNGLSRGQARSLLHLQPPEPEGGRLNCAACARKLDPRLGSLPLLLKPASDTAAAGFGNGVRAPGAPVVKLAPLNNSTTENAEQSMADRAELFEYGFSSAPVARGDGETVMLPIFRWSPKEDIPELWGANVETIEVTVATDGSAVDGYASAAAILKTADFDVHQVRLADDGKHDDYSRAYAAITGARLAGKADNYLAELAGILMALLLVPVSAALTIVYDCTGAVESTAGKPLQVDSGILKDPDDCLAGFRDSVLATLKTSNHGMVNLIRRLIRLRAQSGAGGSLRFVHQHSHTVPETLAAKETPDLHAALNGVADAACEIAMHAEEMGAPPPDRPEPRAPIFTWGARSVTVTMDGAPIRKSIRPCIKDRQLTLRHESARTATRRQSAALKEDPEAMKRYGRWMAGRKGGCGALLLKNATTIIHRQERHNLYNRSGHDECANCTGTWLGGRPRDDHPHAAAGCPCGEPMRKAAAAKVEKVLERATARMSSEDREHAETCRAAVAEIDNTWFRGYWRPNAIIAHLPDDLESECRQRGITVTRTPTRGLDLRLGAARAVVNRQRLLHLVDRTQLAHTAGNHAPASTTAAAACAASIAIAEAFEEYALSTALEDPEDQRTLHAMARVCIEHLSTGDITGDPFNSPMNATCWRHAGAEKSAGLPQHGYTKLLCRAPATTDELRAGRNLFGGLRTADTAAELRDLLLDLHAGDVYAGKQPTRATYLLRFPTAGLRVLREEWTAPNRPAESGTTDAGAPHYLHVVAAWTAGTGQAEALVVLANTTSLVLDPIDPDDLERGVTDALDKVNKDAKGACATRRRTLFRALAFRRRPSATRTWRLATGWPAVAALAAPLRRAHRADHTPRALAGPPRTGPLLAGGMLNLGMPSAPEALLGASETALARIARMRDPPEIEVRWAEAGLVELRDCRNASAALTAGAAVVPGRLAEAVKELTGAADWEARNAAEQIVLITEEALITRFMGNRARWRAHRREEEDAAEATTTRADGCTRYTSARGSAGEREMTESVTIAPDPSSRRRTKKTTTRTQPTNETTAEYEEDTEWEGRHAVDRRYVSTVFGHSEKVKEAARDARYAKKQERARRTRGIQHHNDTLGHGS